MSVALYIVPQFPVDFDHQVDGKALGHADEELLTRFCQQRRVRPLSDFLSAAPEELEDFFEAEAFFEGGMPENEWFEPHDGLETVQALLEHLQEEPDAIDDADDVIADLQEFELVLEQLVKREMCWQLALDY